MLISSYEQRQTRSLENQNELLLALFKSGFSTVKVLSRRLKKSISATYKLVNRLEQRGLISSEEIHELKTKVWVLSREGAFELAAAHRDESIINKQYRVNRISALTLAHELMLQEIHCSANEHGFTEFVYGHTLKGSMLKRPDAVVKDSFGNVRGLEVERFVKSSSRARIILGNYLQEVASGKYCQIDYIAPTEARAWALKKLFYSFKDVEIDGNTYQITDAHRSKLVFYSQAGWPNNRMEG